MLQNHAQMTSASTTTSVIHNKFAGIVGHVADAGGSGDRFLTIEHVSHMMPEITPIAAQRKKIDGSVAGEDHLAEQRPATQLAIDFLPI